MKTLIALAGVYLLVGFVRMRRMIVASVSIHMAARQNSIHELKRLLKNDVNIDAVDKYGYTALMWAVSCGHFECAKVLLDQGAKIDVDTRHSPLMLAVSKKRHSIAVLLIERGANTTEPGLVEAAIEYNNSKILKTLLFSSNFNFQWLQLLAVFKNRPRCLRVLLDYEPDVIMEELVIESVTRSYSRCLRVLLEKGGNPDLVHHGSPILHIAIIDDSTACLEVLIEFDADIEHMDDRNTTPLMMAVFFKNASAMNLLLQNGAYVELDWERVYPCDASFEGKSTLETFARFNAAVVIQKYFRRYLTIKKTTNPYHPWGHALLKARAMRYTT
jgi:ankyrin repeat protein